MGGLTNQRISIMRSLALWMYFVGLVPSAEASVAETLDIQQAICTRDVRAVESALRDNFDVNIVFSDGIAKGFTPLTLALEDIDCQYPVSVDLVMLLVQRGADVNRKAAIYGGASPLSQAARSLDVQAVEYLLRLGADPNVADVNGQTPLMSFSNDKSDKPLRIVEMLLAAGANPSAQAKDGFTPEKWALELRRSDIVELIRRAIGRK